MELEIKGISAVTLFTRDMASAVNFYRNLGFVLAHGGEKDAFTTFRAGPQCLNLSAESGNTYSPWGRVIIYVSDVDALYQRCLNLGVVPEFTPRDAPWGERYFHVTDPDGHEISFAKPLSG